MCGTKPIKLRVCLPRAGVRTGREVSGGLTIYATQQALHIGDRRSFHRAGQKNGLIQSDGVGLLSAAVVPHHCLPDYLDRQVAERAGIAATVLGAGRS